MTVSEMFKIPIIHNEQKQDIIFFACFKQNAEIRADFYPILKYLVLLL